jgi:anti-sigma-K factor RskA
VNIQEYISSGIVESYVLGLADEAEQSEFERMCDAHIEVRRARVAFEEALEREALANAIPPPKSVKSKIFSEIDVDLDQRPARSTLYDDHSQALPEAPVRRMNYRWMAAASILLLIASAALNFYFYRQYKSYSTRYDNLLAQQTQLANTNRAMETKLSEYESSLSHLRDPNMIMVKLPGVAAKPNSMATVFWDKQTKDVYLMVNNLPAPSQGKQYQLWALVDGKPVDAGVIDSSHPADLLLRMKNIPVAQAFAITLEKSGGSPAPTMEAMFVMGNV